MNKPKHVGIVGVTAVGASLCYKQIAVESMNMHGIHPQISVHNHSYSDYNVADFDILVHNLLDSIGRVHASGAEFAVIAANTVHYAYGKVLEKSPIPLLNIIDLTVEECILQGRKKLTVFGTFTTTEYGIYNDAFDKFGIDIIEPTTEQNEKIDHIIASELLNGFVSNVSQEYLLSVIREVKQQGSEAILLGCTELSIALNSDNSDLPCIDSTAVLASKALEYAFGLREIESKTNDTDLATIRPDSASSDASLNTILHHDHRFEVNNPETRTLLEESRICMEAKDFKKAQALLQEAIILEPNHPEARGLLALSYGLMLESSSLILKMKLLPRMEKETKLALKLAPNWTLVRRINGMKLLNTPEQFGGNVQQGVQELLFCIENNFDDFDINFAVAQGYLKLADRMNTKHYLERALSIHPENAKAVKLMEEMSVRY
ncbi:amino acid racemase [Paenibacillus sp. L3-i20]|uniref:amino acid racemase n=1 Tax=Paenibacillus sp. L3-i20 TaxID=2905833 RepID=UPI001EDE4461|nr:amino acid racemase [Paenibacillus sp. L3-i20]GKU77241.1 hypothetical protein L3i20_v216380 [Paenibacillus sp. L3-i20]